MGFWLLTIKATTLLNSLKHDQNLLKGFQITHQHLFKVDTYLWFINSIKKNKESIWKTNWIIKIQHISTLPPLLIHLLNRWRWSVFCFVSFNLVIPYCVTPISVSPNFPCASYRGNKYALTGVDSSVALFFSVPKPI